MLAAELKRKAKIEEVIITTAGSVIASHCGPNTIGILYELK
jgi:fatty acid-binding protein DegV